MREEVGFSYNNHQTLKVGRLLCVDHIQTLPGDSLDITASTDIEFATLVRRMTTPMQLEMFGFWAPLRWSYPNFLEAALGEWGNSTSWILTEDAPVDNGRGFQALRHQLHTVPRHLVQDYAAIIDHNFKEKHQPEINKNNVLTDEADQEYGWRAYQPTGVWPIPTGWTDAYGTQGIGASNTPVIQLSQIIQQGKEDQQRAWNAVRPEERYRAIYEGKLDKEVEEEPVFLGNTNGKVGGPTQTMDPLENTKLQQLMGKASIRFPRKFYEEHGTLYILLLARWRPSYRHAIPLLDQPAILGNNKLGLGHPLGANERPREMQLGELFADTASSTSTGFIKHNDWWKRQPDHWSPAYYTEDTGWIPRATPSSKAELWRHPEYEDIWATPQYAHGKVHTKIRIDGARPTGNQGIEGGL